MSTLREKLSRAEERAAEMMSSRDRYMRDANRWQEECKAAMDRADRLKDKCAEYHAELLRLKGYIERVREVEKPEDRRQSDRRNHGAEKSLYKRGVFDCEATKEWYEL